MKHILERTVYYGDTDSYGVAWHGSYINWMEQGRVEFCRTIGLNLVELMKNDITIPVTNLNIRYKSSARLDDEIVIETEITEITALKVKFRQIIKHKKTDKVFTVGEVEVVAVNGKGKIYRTIPDRLKTPCEEAMKN